MFRKIIILKIILLGLIAVITLSLAFSEVIEENGKTYIVDLHGERWDVSQAVSIGFEPHRFQHGIGRNAFTPLDDLQFNSDNSGVRSQERVIGIAEGEHANAYSVSRLWRHEVANSFIGERPIAAAYWPLVNLAAVYSRRIDGRDITLVPSGWTYDSTFVLYDKESGSLWYPNDEGLMSIQGVYFKRQLPKLDFEDTQWKQWVKEHPHSKIMK